MMNPTNGDHRRAVIHPDTLADLVDALRCNEPYTITHDDGSTTELVPGDQKRTRPDSYPVDFPDYPALWDIWADKRRLVELDRYVAILSIKGQWDYAHKHARPDRDDLL